MCSQCLSAYLPEERNGVRVLKTWKSYTVDLRLRQFRKVALGKPPEFVAFESPKGRRLLSTMHKEAME